MAQRVEFRVRRSVQTTEDEMVNENRCWNVPRVFLESSSCSYITVLLLPFNNTTTITTIPMEEQSGIPSISCGHHTVPQLHSRRWARKQQEIPVMEGVALTRTAQHPCPQCELFHTRLRRFAYHHCLLTFRLSQQIQYHLMLYDPLFHPSILTLGQILSQFVC